jgi:hypothetical protein
VKKGVRWASHFRPQDKARFMNIAERSIEESRYYRSWRRTWATETPLNG